MAFNMQDHRLKKDNGVKFMTHEYGRWYHLSLVLGMNWHEPYALRVTQIIGKFEFVVGGLYNIKYLSIHKIIHEN